MSYICQEAGRDGLRKAWSGGVNMGGRLAGGKTGNWPWRQSGLQGCNVRNRWTKSSEYATNTRFL